MATRCHVCEMAVTCQVHGGPPTGGPRRRHMRFEKRQNQFFGSLASHIRPFGSPRGGNDVSQRAASAQLFTFFSIQIFSQKQKNHQISDIRGTPRTGGKAPPSTLEVLYVYVYAP